MKQYLIQDLHDVNRKFTVDIDLDDHTRCVNSLCELKTGLTLDNSKPVYVCLNTLMENNYSVTIQDKPETLLFDFTQEVQNPDEEILKSKAFQIVYDTNYQDYLPDDIMWSEFPIEDFQVKLEKIGYTDLECTFDIDNCQGRGSSFDGKISVSKFMELNPDYFYLELANAIDRSFVEEYVNICKNGYASRYHHEKTRFVDTFESSDDEVYSVLDEERLGALIAAMEGERLELCKYLTKVLEGAHELEFSKERLLEIFKDNQYRFGEEGKIV